MVQPLHDWVMIEPIANESKTASGIIIPNAAIPKPVKGTVISVGTPECSVQPGDIVFYPKHSVNSIKDGDNEYLIVKESELLCVIKKV
jgi:chaperonin GroES